MYKDKRFYILDLKKKQYTYKIGKEIKTCGPLYNIYVRLMRQPRGSLGKRLFYLHLGGYCIEGVRISGATDNVDALRDFGQKIAEALQLNYFDEANTSKHHRVRQI
ncbi:hypothetical protein ROZALSC1DRAFT_30247, partial [Rozella allomycis CSF55]